MTRYQIEPLARWPWPETPAEERRPNPFRSTFARTLQDLARECDLLDIQGALAIHVVTDSPNDVRRDGMLRAHAQVRHPGVAVSFVSRFGPLTYPCDAFYNRYVGSPDWQINLRAIALGLGALRTLDRYGMRGQQYVGYLALPAGSGAAGGNTTGDALTSRDGADRFLRSLVDDAQRGAPIRQVWRVATKRHHPDVVGGETGMWDAVQRAGRTLGLTV